MRPAKRFVSSGETSASFWPTAGRRSWAVAVTREWRRKPLKTLKMDSGNGKPSAHVLLAGGSMTRIPSHRSRRKTFSASSGPGWARGSAKQNQGHKKLRKSAGKSLKRLVRVNLCATSSLCVERTAPIASPVSPAPRGPPPEAAMTAPRPGPQRDRRDAQRRARNWRQNRRSPVSDRARR
jgi:hypothetical protein